MPRERRVVVPGVPHHITTRGNNRRRLFSYRPDYARFVVLVERALAKTRCLLHQITLMVNHVHMLITPPTEESLAVMMKAVCHPYARYWNDRRGASGKLFEERYFSEATVTDEHLAAATVYCDTNAYRAGRAEVAEEHPWSTVGLHAGLPHLSKIPSRIWTPSAWYRGLGDTDVERARQYRVCLDEYLARPDRAGSIRERLEAVESVSGTPYTRRLVRPDGSSAREAAAAYGSGRIEA